MGHDHEAIEVIALAIGIVIALSAFTHAAIERSDSTSLAAPTNNGTSYSINVTGRMQQYVGFYGTITVEVRKQTQTGNVMYNTSATTGRLYWVLAASTPQFASSTGAPTNSLTDGNLSLTGYYVTGNHYSNVGSICGISGVGYINTTDGYGVGLLKDNQTGSPANFYFCVDIHPAVSTHGFGVVQYQAVVPKTSVYQTYDVWFDLTS